VAIKAIRGFLDKVNIESGKSENIFELAQLEQQLVFRPNETIVSRLGVEDARERSLTRSGFAFARQKPRTRASWTSQAARRQQG
jgi:hypothetical protein